MRRPRKLRTDLRLLGLASLGLSNAALCILAFAATAAAAQAKKSAPAVTDAQAVRAYVLTRYKVHELGEAIADLADYQDAHPDVADAMGAAGPNADITHLTQRIQKYPAVVALLHKDGFTPRGYVVATMTLSQAMSAVTLKLNGAYPDYPPETVKLIGRANLAFVERDLDDIVHVIDALSPGPDVPPSSPAGDDPEPN